MGASAEWLDDYQQNWRDYKGPEISEEEMRRMDRAYQQGVDQGQQWAEEYTQEEQQSRLDEEAWFSKYVGDNWRTAKERNRAEAAGGEWAREYNGNRETEAPHPWVDEYHREFPPTGEEDISRLTANVAEIPHAKLQESNFMKFLHSVNNGEVVFDEENNRVVRPAPFIEEV